MKRAATWRRAALALASTAALLAGLGGCATLDEKQRAWIFAPSDRTWAGGLAAAQGMQEVWIDAPAAASADAPAPVRLHGLWLPAERPGAPVLLYLHGARWDVRGSAPRMRRMHELGFSVLGLDYRGFGQSTPALPSEASATADALLAWQWLARQHPGTPRYLYGHSLGGAIAVNLAAQVPDVAGLIVEGSFTSIPDVVAQYKWGWLPVGPLITQRFEAGRAMAGVRAPVLVVHGTADNTIPEPLGRALFEQAPGPKRYLPVPGGSHHNSLGVALPEVRLALAELFGLPGPAAVAR